MLTRALMPAIAAGVLLSGSAAGQVPKVPEKVDKALRARVNEFFQYHVDGNFRKAMDLVADDTKDEYFASGKTLLMAFTLDDIKYSDKFDKATVTITAKREWEIRMQKNLVTIPMVTTWKMEHGKWVWYHNKQGDWLTPMGPSDYKAIKPNPDGTLTMPKINQDTVNAAAQKILDFVGVNKGDVRFVIGKAGSDKVVFNNAVQGSVQLELTPMEPVQGLTVKLDKTDVGIGQSANVVFTYEPQEKQPPQQALARFTVIPFNTTYVITIHFDPAESAQ